jgi:hypothetical protein
MVRNRCNCNFVSSDKHMLGSYRTLWTVSERWWSCSEYRMVYN